MYNIIIAIKKIYSLFVLSFLFSLLIIINSYSSEKIGTVVNLKNEVIAINVDGEKRLLDLYDEILLKDKILTNELSNITIEYNDNSTIIIKESSSFEVTEFDILGLKDIFLGKTEIGTIIIESGKISKKNNGLMVIELPASTIDVKGTRFNIKNNPNGTSEVSLAKDSFGNVGVINISSEGVLKTLFDTEQVVSIDTTSGISERPKTEDEKIELEEVSNALVEASSINDNLIQSKLEEKLLNGDLEDANNDGTIDENDVEIIVENIKTEKQEKINFIVEYSTSENSEFLSNILNISDSASIGQSMEMMFETNNDLISSVITNLANEDSSFLTSSDLEANNEIKDKIFTQMLNESDEDNDNIAVITDIISKSDIDSVDFMLETIQTVNENIPESTIALEVLSSMAENESFDEIDFGNEGQDLFDNMMEDAVLSAVDSEEGAEMLAVIIVKSDTDIAGTMLDYISEVSSEDPNSTLVAEVLSSVVSNEVDSNFNLESEKIDQIYDLVDTVAYTDPADTESSASNDTEEEDLYDADGFSLIPPYYHKDTGMIYNPAGFDRDGNFNGDDDTSDDDGTYDANGFSLIPPYYHRDTGTVYDMDGFDRNGNTDDSDSDDTYDENGFSLVPPYYHRDTGTAYNNAGIDRDGNTEDSAASNPFWVMEPTFASEYNTSDSFSVTANAESSPAANGVNYSASGFPDGVTIDSGSGDITGTTQMAGSYSVIITATDAFEPTYQISTSSFSIEVIEYDENGFNTSSPYFHRDTGTLYDNDGYNSAGFNSSGYNAAMEYNPAYDEDASES